MSSYKELIVWQKSIQLVTDIYKLTKIFPKEEYEYNKTFGKQIAKVADYVPECFELTTRTVQSDDWKDAEEEMDEYLEEMSEDMEELDDEDKIKIKEFGDVEKEGKNLWKIERRQR